jgi:FkbM family methyltransferase
MRAHSGTRHLIFDVGLNVGQDTAFYLSRGHRVVAIEADPTLAEAARRRFCLDIEAGNLDIVNAGIADHEGVAEFWICDGKSEFNSFHENIAARDGYPHHRIEVPTVRFASILERFGTPYFLKIDIEGHDELCLADLAPSSLPRFISVESECTAGDGATTVEDGLRVLGTLRDLGYRKFKLIDQRTFCSLAVPSVNYLLDSFARRVLDKPPLNGLRGTYRLSQYLMVRPRLERKFRRGFPLGSSGVAGNDTPGRWIKYEQAAHAYRHYRSKHFQDLAARPYSFWCDWHATR